MGSLLIDAVMSFWVILDQDHNAKCVFSTPVVMVYEACSGAESSVLFVQILFVSLQKLMLGCLINGHILFFNLLLLYFVGLFFSPKG